jgi:hypothetical protein
MINLIVSIKKANESVVVHLNTNDPEMVEYSEELGYEVGYEEIISVIINMLSNEIDEALDEDRISYEFLTSFNEIEVRLNDNGQKMELKLSIPRVGSPNPIRSYTVFSVFGKIEDLLKSKLKL